MCRSVRWRGVLIAAGIVAALVLVAWPLAPYVIGWWLLFSGVLTPQ